MTEGSLDLIGHSKFLKETFFKDRKADFFSRMKNCLLKN